VIGEISRRGNRWDCMVPSDASAVTRRLLCVAARRAEDRYRQRKADE
jgi:hypothetical protein